MGLIMMKFIDSIEQMCVERVWIKFACLKGPLLYMKVDSNRKFLSVYVTSVLCLTQYDFIVLV